MSKQEVTEAFRDILRRIKSEENKDRYNSLGIRTTSESEERIWTLCEKFWPAEYEARKENIDDYIINENLDLMMAKRYLAELEELLDSLGWAE